MVLGCHGSLGTQPMTNSLARELADLLPQVLAALAVDDPKRGLEAALGLLADHGLVRRVAEEPAFFEVEYRGRTLSLSSTQP